MSPYVQIGDAMSPRTRLRIAQVLIPLALAVAIVSAIVGLWLLVVAMVLSIVGVLGSLRADCNRRV
jgi:uncharacterized membrane protein